VAELVGGALGAAVGAAINPAFAWKGFQIGAALGSLYSAVEQSNQSFQGSRLDDLRITGASHGAPIPIVFGTVRVPGNIMWAPNLTEIENQAGGGGSLGGPTFNNYSYLADLAIEVCEGEITRFSRVWADSELIYDYNGGTPIWAEYIDPDKVTFYTGTMSQTADPLISAERVGAGDQAPAYIGRAYVVFEDFPWSKFGRTPNFNFEVVRGTSVTLEDVVDELIDRVGVDVSERDLSAFSSVTISGYMIPSRMELASALTLLLRVFNSDLIECDGEIRGVLKDVASSFSLDSKWLGCATDGDAPKDRFEITRIQELELPRSIDVRYISPANDHQQFVQRAVRLIADTQSEGTLDLPLVLTDDHARHAAETALYEEWENRTRIKTSYPLNYLEIAPGDVGTITIDGTVRTVRVVDQVLGMPGHIEVTVVMHDGSVYTQFVEGATPPAGASVSNPGDYTIWVQDINALRDEDAGGAVLYGGACRAGSWVGTAISTNSTPPLNTSWIRNAPFPSVGLRSAIGELVSALAPAEHGVWDRTNTVDVELVAGTLTSVTEAEVLAGANLCIIGNEILQFATATLIATNTYRLSTLLRGRRGSEWAIATHAIGSKFAMADNLLAATFPVSSQGLAFNMRVTNGWDLVSNEESGTAVCRSRMPYAPCNVRGSRDISENLTITWNRRSRTAPLGPFAEPPLDETSEMYEVDIMDGVTVVRTISATSPTCAYSAADQVTDFGGVPEDGITVRVYQLSPGWIRGFAAEATI
jgi:hypothetical protein